MPRCPHCDAEIDGIDDLEIDLKRSDSLAIGMFACPSCDVILGVGGAGRNRPGEE